METQITRRQRSDSDVDFASTPILYSDNESAEASYQNVDENIQKNEPVKSKPKTNESWWLACIKIALIVGMFLFFVGTVVLIVELIEKYHSQEVYSLNLHITVGDECTQEARRVNQAITDKDPHQQIMLNSASLPHMTLYLTTFTKTNQQPIIDALNKTIFGFNGTASSWPTNPCTVTMVPKLVATGDYTMWNSDNPECLQFMSDMVVNATRQFIDTRATMLIPSWVDRLPAYLRILKTDMIKNYGSPNVFSQFDPHVTIAHDDITPSDMAKVVQGPPPIQPKNCTFIVSTVAIGLTGDYGTVQSGKDLAEFTFR
jgi:hypothetical protein